jgi:hypothetical protein
MAGDWLWRARHIGPHPSGGVWCDLVRIRGSNRLGRIFVGRFEIRQAFQARRTRLILCSPIFSPYDQVDLGDQQVNEKNSNFELSRELIRSVCPGMKTIERAQKIAFKY